MSLNILPECYADTQMINTLGFKKVNHCDSIGEVANTMIKNYKNKLAIGIIDRDKPGWVPSYFNDFQVYKTIGNIEIKKLVDTKHYIVVVAPALESYLLDLASSLDIPIDKYGFKDLNSLKRITKSKKLPKNEKFKSFLNSLSQKNGSPLKQLKLELNKLIDS
jgi:hypothetical protein